MANSKSTPSALLVCTAFATVYLVWGSTYFFIQKAIEGFPPFMLGALRFFAAALIMLGWCLWKGEKVLELKHVKHSVISGLLLLLVGNGAVIWVEQYLPSALVAILISSSPLWFVALDKPRWQENFRSRTTLLGLLTGFAGVVILFYPNISEAFSVRGSVNEAGGMALLVLGTMSWAGGSLYSKYKTTGSATVNSTWQMLSAGLAFLVISLSCNETAGFDPWGITAEAWWALAYLVIFGSIAGYSAYVWLLEVRPASQVSTYAYVNPVVAVLLGVFFAGEHVTFLQILGLVIILVSVLMINLAKYRKTQ